MGFRYGSGKRELSKEEFDDIERVLPGPHDPAQLSHLYLEGKSKLKLEAETAKKSKHLVVLNPRNSKINYFTAVKPETCLIEQD